MNKSSLCRRCGERVAIIYLTKYENGKPVHEGYCLKCAKEMKLPHVNDVLERFGISDEDIDNFSNQLNDAMNGQGMLRLANGIKYKGGFVNGLEHGAGVAVDKDGTRYEGTFVEGQRHGKFIVKSSDGKVVRECVYNLGQIAK